MQEWHGEPGTTVTERFSTNGRTRVAWSLTGTERNSFLDIYVRNAEGRIVRGAVNLPGDHNASPAGAFALSDQAGVYFLEIISTNARWRVAVEQAGGRLR